LKSGSYLDDSKSWPTQSAFYFLQTARNSHTFLAPENGSTMDKSDKTDLDALDRRLLAHLQRDGRASNVEMSAAVHLSAPQCFRRVKALEERGVIRGYTAHVDREALGYGVMAYVSVDLGPEQFGRVREVEQILRSFPQILECHTVSGDSDYLLKVVARDLKNLSQFLTDRLMQIPGVANVRSMICLEEIKPSAPLPVD